MKNSKGISLIALIITIIVIIILAAIVIGGVFNTPNDAKFANFCQEYDRIQTAIQLRYYELYQKYAIDATLTEVPTHYQIYYEVASGNAVNGTDYDYKNASSADAKDESRWVKIDNWGTAAGQICEKPTGLNDWYLRTNDGKLAYNGFEKEEKVMFYTPNVSVTSTGTGAAARPKVQASETGAPATEVANTTDLNSVAKTDANLGSLARDL